MSELVSAYPTSGGIYWWASKLGGPAAGFFTGWLNLIGLVAVTARCVLRLRDVHRPHVQHLLASRAPTTTRSGASSSIFLIVLALAALLNIFSSHLMAIMNNVSVWWHVVGASAIVLILIFVPDQHQSFSYVFTERFNNSGYADGSTSSARRSGSSIVPFGFLLTQYTITGFDACAHLSEETSSASTAAAKGIWRSIFYSAIGGYILLLAWCSRSRTTRRGNPTTRGSATAASPYIFDSALGQELGDAGAVHLGVGAVLLRHRPA